MKSVMGIPITEGEIPRCNPGHRQVVSSHDTCSSVLDTDDYLAGVLAVDFMACG